MKKIFTLAIGLLACISLLEAQVTMTRSSHGFNPGDIHFTQEVKYKDPGTNGTGQVWDFSNVEPIGAVDTSVIGNNENGLGVVVTRNSDKVLTYYISTNDANEYYGYDMGVWTFKLDNPVVKVRYPQTYGTFFEGVFTGNVFIGGNDYGKIEGNYSTNVDGNGTIILPNNISLPAIRVKTTERMPNTICNCNKGEVIETVKYLWYAQDTRYPLFVSITNTTYNTLDNKVVSTTQHSYMNTDAKPAVQPVNKLNNIPDVAYEVSPNPFQDNIFISYDLPQKMNVNIDLYNTQGVKLANIVSSQMQEGKQSVSFFAAPYVNKGGVYFLQIQFGNKTYSEKIVRVAR